MRRHADGASDLHCGGIDDERPLPAFLRREPLLEVTAGIVARRDHPIQAARPTPADLGRHLWLDCYASAHADGERRGPSLAGVLERLRARTGARVGPVLRAGAAGLLLLVNGPRLLWAPLALLARLPLAFGRRRYRTGLVARRSAEDLAPVQMFEDIVRAIALEGTG